MSEVTYDTDVIFGYVDLKFWHEVLPDGRIALGSTAFHYGRDYELKEARESVSTIIEGGSTALLSGPYICKRGEPQPRCFPRTR